MKYIVIAVAVTVIILMVVRLRGGKPEKPGRSSQDSQRPLLRQFGDLRPQDFDQHPVWVHCHVIDYDEPWYDDTDEETFRPWDKGSPADPAKTMFLVKATLTLTDGTVMSGFVTPQNPRDSGGNPDLGLIQPQVFLPNGERVGFWFGILTPPQDEISSFYSVLSKSQQDVFPIAFKANEGLAKGITTGSIPGFCSSGNGDEINVTK
jgi:hypothetical protein